MITKAYQNILEIDVSDRIYRASTELMVGMLDGKVKFWPVSQRSIMSLAVFSHGYSHLHALLCRSVGPSVGRDSDNDAFSRA